MGELGPTLLTLDDVQWADELSIALCLYVLRAASSARQPLLLVVAGRDTPAIAALEDAVRHVLDPDAVASISLRPLDRDAGLNLLREAAPALGAAEPRRSGVLRLDRRSGCTPSPPGPTGARSTSWRRAFAA